MYDISKRDRQRGGYGGYVCGWFNLYVELARCMLILFTGSATPRCISPLWVLKTTTQRRQTMLPPIRADPVRPKTRFLSEWTRRGRLPRIRDAWLS